MINVFKGLLVKEFKEAVRDRRAMMAAFFAILMGPVMMAGMILFQIDEITEIKPPYVEFSGSENAPSLIAYLASNKIVPISDIPEEDAAKWKKCRLASSFQLTFQPIWNSANKFQWC